MEKKIKKLKKKNLLKKKKKIEKREKRKKKRRKKEKKVLKRFYGTISMYSMIFYNYTIGLMNYIIIKDLWI